MFTRLQRKTKKGRPKPSFIHHRAGLHINIGDKALAAYHPLDDIFVDIQPLQLGHFCKSILGGMAWQPLPVVFHLCTA